MLKWSFECWSKGWLRGVGIVVLILLSPGFAQEWGPDVRLTDNIVESYTSDNNAWCVVAVGDTVHVVFWDDTYGEEIVYKCSYDNGETWEKDVRLSYAPGHSWYPSIAVSGDYIHIVWHDASIGAFFNIFYKRSTDNGQTWEDDVIITNNSFDSEHPSIAASENDVHLVWCELKPTDSYYNAYIYYKRSTDNGETWQDTIKVSENTGAYSWARYPSVAVIDNCIHVVWHDASDGIWKICYRQAKFYSDIPPIWGEIKVISDAADSSKYPCIAASGNNIHVAWHHPLQQVGSEIYYDRSTDNGETWGEDVKLTNTSGLSWHPSLAVCGDTIHMTWLEVPPYVYAKEVYYKNSFDNGETWEEGQRLTFSDPDKNCQNPSIAICGNDIHVVWTDQRDGEGGLWGNTEVYYKHGEFDEVDVVEMPAETEACYLQLFTRPYVIQYGIPEAGKVDMVLYDITGREVRTLISEEQPAGHYRIEWDGCDDNGINLPTGVYFCQLRMKEHSIACKFVLLR